MAKHTRLRLTSALVVLVLLVALSVFSWPDVTQSVRTPSVPWSKADGTWYRSITYDYYRRHSFDLYIPRKALPSDTHGMMVFIHGGGWNGGSKRDMQDEARSFAKAGYVAVVMDYSLITPYDRSVTMLTMLDDIDHTIDKAQRILAILGYRVNKVGLYGYSAGAHLSMLYAYSRPNRPIPVVFVVAKAGRVDFRIRPIPSIDRRFAAEVSQWTGTRVTTDMVASGEDRAALRKISPATYVTAASPPTVFAYGEYDTLVRPQHGEVLDELLTRAGVTHNWYIFRESGHGLNRDEKTRVDVFTTALSYAQRYFDD